MKKLVVITGAATGFGKLLALRLSERGYHVIATMRKVEERKFSTSENITYLELDIQNAEQRLKLKNYIEQNHNGKLDVLVNNAGFGAYGALEDSGDDYIDKQMDVNVNATAKLTRDLLPLIRQAEGKILFLSSIVGIASMPLSSLYSASKFALEGLAQGLAYEVSPFNVQVATVCPGRHRTDFVKNLTWPITTFDQSAYSKFYSGLQRMMTKFSTGRPVPADNVAIAIEKALSKSKLPRRIVVGSDAKMLYFMQKLLPFGFFMKLTDNVYRKGLLK